MTFRPTRMEVNLSNIQANYSAIRKFVGPKPQIFAVIKADAYGHGAVRVARALIEAGCGRFAVATPDEAIELRDAGIGEPILVLGSSPYDVAGEYVRRDITATCTDTAFAKELSRAAVAQGKNAIVHIKVDTGMGRIGFLPEQIASVAEELLGLPGIRIEGLFTHFATADESRLDYTALQYGRYLQALGTLEARGIRIPLRHVCNSAGILTSKNMPDRFLDAVRPGVILYGMWPSGECVRPIELKPTFEVKTAIAVVRELPERSGVGYGLRYMTRGTEKIAVLPIGYADGYSRSLSMKVDVLVKGKRVPMAGNICMDQTMINVTGMDVNVGEEVVLVGRQGADVITPEEIAAVRGTINYEVPIMFLKRVPRVYI
jgi:alanine racemase